MPTIVSMIVFLVAPSIAQNVCVGEQCTAAKTGVDVSDLYIQAHAENEKAMRMISDHAKALMKPNNNFDVTQPCDETLSGEKNTGYRGCQSEARNGRTCLPWSSSNSYTEAKYPNMGLGNHNHCRNPDIDETIWCMTVNSGGRNWDYCDPKPTLPQYEPCNSFGAQKTCPMWCLWMQDTCNEDKCQYHKVYTSGFGCNPKNGCKPLSKTDCTLDCSILKDNQDCTNAEFCSWIGEQCVEIVD